MAKKAVVFSQFDGGLSDGPKTGIRYSAAGLQALDIRTDPGQMSVMPGMVREDAGVVKDLILNEVMAQNGIIYAVGNAGYVYRRTTGGAWSEIGKLSSGAGGIDYRVDTDSIYLTSNTTASVITGVVNGTPTLLPDKYASSVSTYNNSPNTMPLYVNSNQTGGSKTVALKTAANVTEQTTDLRYFQTDIEPINKISVFVVTPGAGNWTLALHDGLNTVLATATIGNGALKTGAFNDFIFSSAPHGQVRVYPAPNARTYHIHVISTVADGTISSTATNDMSTCDLQVWADRLVYPVSGLHPMDRFLQYELIGNGNYVTAWEPISDPPTNSEWQRLRLTVPMEYDNMGIDHTNEYSVALWGKTTTAATMSAHEGLLTFWSGTNDTYDYDLPIAEGVPYCLHVYKNVVYYYCAGIWWETSSPTTQPTPSKQLPAAIGRFTPSTTPTTMYPYGATVQNGIQLLAWPGATTNPNINMGVYGWGQLNKNYPQSLTYDYLPSTGSQNYSASNNLQLGMVKAFGDILHLSWRDDQGSGTPKYGIDVVTNTSSPASYAKYVTIQESNAYAGKKKMGAYVDAYFPNLPTGATVQLSYSLNRGAFIYDANVYSSTNLFQGENGYARFDVTLDSAGSPGGRFREIQGQLEIRCSAAVTVPPAVPEVAIVFDDLREEALQ